MFFSPKWPFRGDAEKSPKGLHLGGHGSTKRDGSSARLGVPEWDKRLGRQNPGKVGEVSEARFFSGVCSLPATIFLFEQNMCI